MAFACLLWLRRWLLWLADSIVPAELVVTQVATGGIDAAVLRVLVLSNIAESLVASGPRRAEQLAHQLRLDMDATARICGFAAAHGMVGRDRQGRYWANRRTRQMAGGTADFVRYATDPGLRGAVAALHEVVRSGADAFETAHGMAVWPYFVAHPDEGATFNSAMAGLSVRDAHEIACRLGPDRLADACDVGGGLGTFVEALLIAAPEAKATLFDTVDVVAAAQRRLADSPLAWRVTYAPGSFFEHIPHGKSCYVLRTILHDWDDAHCRTILARCVQAMGPGACLAIVEATLSERGAWAPLAARMDLTMLIATQRGRQRTAAQMRTLLMAAGLKVDARSKLASAFDLWLCSTGPTASASAAKILSCH